MRVTTIKFETPELTYLNTVCHECTCGEFLRDIAREVRGFLEKNQPGVQQVDIFWHLDKYCDEKYGACHWQIITIKSLKEIANILK